MCISPVNLMGKQVPCGSCIECERMKANEYAFRAYLESTLHDDNCFITLTYDNEHLPDNGSLKRKDLQDFIKRLRKFCKVPIKVFYCGEYGKERSRPHYHMIIFGFDFDDKYQFFEKSGNVIYRSDTLERLWTFGLSSVGEVCFDDIKYIAKYCQKQLFRDERKVSGYNFIKEMNRNINLKSLPYKQIPTRIKFKDYYGIISPFIGLSHGLGFGAFRREWLESDKIYINGNYIKIPRIYLDKVCANYPTEVQRIKEKRLNNQLLNKKSDDEIVQRRRYVLAKLKKIVIK